MTFEEKFAVYERVLKEMRELSKGTGDTEAAHGRADDLLVELIKALGFDELAELYDKVDKWYA